MTSPASIPEWIAAASGAVTAPAVTFGVAVSVRQLRPWRRERIAVRRAEAALALADEACDVLDAAGSRFMSRPRDVEDPTAYGREVRHRHLREHREVFRALRRSRIGLMALVGDDDAADAIDTSVTARIESMDAIQPPAENHRASGGTVRDDHEVELRQRVLPGFGGSDPLGDRQAEARGVLFERLIPVIRVDR